MQCAVKQFTVMISFVTSFLKLRCLTFSTHQLSICSSVFCFQAVYLRSFTTVASWFSSDTHECQKCLFSLNFMETRQVMFFNITAALPPGILQALRKSCLQFSSRAIFLFLTVSIISSWQAKVEGS